MIRKFLSPKTHKRITELEHSLSSSRKGAEFLSKEVERLEKEKEVLREELLVANEKKTLSGILGIILGKDLSWFDYSELSQRDWNAYHLSAQRILSENVLNNEMNFLKSTWGKEAIILLAEDPSMRVQDHIRQKSWMLLGIELLKQRLSEIPSPNTQNEKPTKPFSAI